MAAVAELDPRVVVLVAHHDVMAIVGDAQKQRVALLPQPRAGPLVDSQLERPVDERPARELEALRGAAVGGADDLAFDDDVDLDDVAARASGTASRRAPGRAAAWTARPSGPRARSGT